MKHLTHRAKAKKFLVSSIFVLTFAQIFAVESFAQKGKVAAKSIKKPIAASKVKTNSAADNGNGRGLGSVIKVTQIDEIALKNLLTRGGANSKPLLVNFWATWCDPCREEYPDLVKINDDYAGKIDFVTVSLDDLAEIKRDVPKFLAEMRATMPAYLLKTEDEQAAIALISKDYTGGLPFTILFDGNGATAYSVQGKVKPDVLRAELDKLSTGREATILDPNTKIRMELRHRAENSENPFQTGADDALEDIMSGKLQIISSGEGTVEKTNLKHYLKDDYKVEMLELGCKMSVKLIEYIKGYNEISTIEIKRKFGDTVLAKFIQN